MLEQNRTVFDALGITRWHEAGYTGKRIKALSYDFRFFVPDYMKDSVEVLWADKYAPGDINTSESAMHGWCVVKVFLEACPDAKVYQTVDPTDKAHELFAWIREHRPCVGFSSMHSVKHGFDSVYAESEGYLSLFSAAGNYPQMSEPSGRIADESWFGVGAATWLNGGFIPTAYSVKSEHLDFVAPTNTKIQAQGGVAFPFTGTSAACPLGAGMCALINDYFIDKIGRALSRSEMFNFITAHCLDMNTEGHDAKTGYGVFVLPDPATLNPHEWIDGGEYLENSGGDTVRDRVVEIARGELGYLEKASAAQLDDKTANAGSANYTKYGAWYGLNPAQWCAMFVSWVMDKAGAGAAAPRYSFCYTGINWFKQNAQWSLRTERHPQAGDVIFFSTDTYPRGGGHTGIVTGTDGSYVYTVEGNTSGGSEVVSNGGGVAAKKYALNYDKIYGYGTPNYTEDDDMTGEEIYAKLTEYLKGQPIPKWAEAEYQEAIAAGITDGSDPCVLTPRYQASIMDLRTGKKFGGAK